MHKVWLIAKREYLERVRAKSFLVMTVLIPLLMGAFVFGSAIVNGRSKPVSHFAVVTDDAQFGLDLQDDLQGNHNGTTVEVISPPAPDTRAMLTDELEQKDLDGYLWVTTSNSPHARPRFQWVPKSKADIVTKDKISRSIRAVLTREQLSHSGIGAEDINALMQPVTLDSSVAGRADSANSAFAVAYALYFLLYFVIVLYGMNVARSIIEEKTSRVFEVLLATIQPEEMMAGKVIGVGSVGLTQVGIWIAAGAILTRFGLFGNDFSIVITLSQVIFFIVFFLLGYVLYSSIAAALGAMTSSEQELQQLNMFLMMPLLTCTIIIFKVVTDSDGMLAKVFSFIPLCTPLIMYVRIAVHQPPASQIAIAIIELLITICAVLWVASRIYRVGILMYGKKPSLREIFRWIKYS